MIVIVKSDGTETLPMHQPQVQLYLQNVLKSVLKVSGGSKITNLSQALNDISKGEGKASGNYRFRNQPVLHASAGVAGVSSVTLLFYRQGAHDYIFAMGSHKGSSSYVLDAYGQTGDATYKHKAGISL